MYTISAGVSLGQGQTMKLPVISFIVISCSYLVFERLFSFGDIKKQSTLHILIWQRQAA
jgi:hypothetical protein